MPKAMRARRKTTKPVANPCSRVSAVPATSEAMTTFSGRNRLSRRPAGSVTRRLPTRTDEPSQPLRIALLGANVNGILTENGAVSSFDISVGDGVVSTGAAALGQVTN